MAVALSGFKLTDKRVSAFFVVPLGMSFFEQDFYDKCDYVHSDKIHF